ncbi:MAG: glutamate permease [Frankiales bacterium]|jgi:glutamate transport system permease protein|nr:glutamate permease [Frankiales bacterium]
MAQSVLYDVQGPRARRRVLIGSVVGALVVLALLALVVGRLAANDQFAGELYRPFFEEPDLWRRIGEGLQNTLKAAVIALGLALVLGTLLAFGRLSTVRWLRWIASTIIEFFRGVPLLLLILFFFLAFPIVFKVDLPPLWALVFGLTLYNGAVIAEIIRAGVNSLPRGQTEAALAVGLTRTQVLMQVLLPQAVRIMLPALVSQLVVLLKDTSLGFVISFEELLRTGGQIVQVLNNPLQVYLLIALIYILINLSLSRLASYLEGRQRRTYGGAVPSAQAVESGMGQAGPQGP